jgi:hypothetical protein
MASGVVGLLNIHITAVRGGAQFRPDSTSKWRAVTAGLDVPEGVEFRTGPKGTVQFTVGTDQVYRVDRLTVLKVLRADLNADGTIHTDVGMTYGRVSKDVDLPEHPHQDTITSPCSTLAVRGTHVSDYDQPPYTPEAASLTGQAYYRILDGEIIAFGGEGTGFAKVDGFSQSAGDYQVNSTLIDPDGLFSGHTAAELQAIITSIGSLNGTQLNIFSSFDSTTGAPPATSILGVGSSGSITVGSSGNGQLPPGTGLVTVPSLSIAPGGSFDITNNALAIDFGSPKNDPVATVAGLLAAGYNNGAWNGTGLVSSTAAAGAPGETLSVGYADGNTDPGTPAKPNQIVVKFTLAGDANLDGKVTSADLLAVLQNFNKTGTDWAQGNFTYITSGPSTTSADLLLVLQNFNKSLPPAKAPAP